MDFIANIAVVIGRFGLRRPQTSQLRRQRWIRFFGVCIVAAVVGRLVDERRGQIQRTVTDEEMVIVAVCTDGDAPVFFLILVIFSVRWMLSGRRRVMVDGRRGRRGGCRCSCSDVMRPVG